MSGNTDTEPANEDAPDADLDAYLLMAASRDLTTPPSATVTQLRQALNEGVTEVDALREVVAHSTGRPRTPSLAWIGPKTFDARHRDRGLDEDFGMRWAPNTTSASP